VTRLLRSSFALFVSFVVKNACHHEGHERHEGENRGDLRTRCLAEVISAELTREREGYFERTLQSQPFRLPIFDVNWIAVKVSFRVVSAAVM
jgi:hypothetical protein